MWADLKGTSLFNTTEKHFLLQVSSYLSYRRYLKEEKTLLGLLRDTSTDLSINFLSCSCEVLSGFAKLPRHSFSIDLIMNIFFASQGFLHGDVM